MSSYLSVILWCIRFYHIHPLDGSVSTLLCSQLNLELVWFCNSFYSFFLPISIVTVACRHSTSMGQFSSAKKYKKDIGFLDPSTFVFLLMSLIFMGLSDDTCRCKWCCFLSTRCSIDGNHLVPNCNLWCKQFGILL